jgi:GST-like protein
MTIQLHVWPTPNAYKISIMLEETGLPYAVVPVNIGAGDQFQPDFLKIAPNNRMPAIVDPDGPGGRKLALFESGAILIYLAEKTGKFRPKDDAAWFTHLQWLMWQMGGVGPMFGQANHFLTYAPEKLPYAMERYTNEAKRLLRVADRRLGEAAYLGGEYGIADMATFPWVRSILTRIQVDEADMVNVQRWMDTIAARPAVQRGLALMAEQRKEGLTSAAAKEVLYGKTQFEKR